MVRNIRLLLEYDGTDYYGFQDQARADHPTIQSTLIHAIFRVTGERVTLHGAGRTDAGVHAVGQVANFRTSAGIPTERIAHALNAVLPRNISVQEASEVPPTFHARYDARSKMYRYMIWNAPHRSPMWGRYSLHVERHLDVPVMQQGAAHLVGTDDFSAFRSTGTTVRSSVRTVSLVSVHPVPSPSSMMGDGAGPAGGDGRRQGLMLAIEVEADGFLTHMVRIIVGTLLDVGRGRWPPERVRHVLLSKDRQLAGTTAPPHGLCLVKVEYGLSGVQATHSTEQS